MIWSIIFGICAIVGAILLGASIGEHTAKHERFGFWDVVGILICVLLIACDYALSLASMTLCPPDKMEYPAAEYQFDKKLLKTEAGGVVTNVDIVYFIRKKQQK